MSRKITIGEAALLALEDLKQPANHWTILKRIQERQYFDFGQAKTPESSVSAQLGDFVRRGDTRINRSKQANGTYLYFLTHWENPVLDTPPQQAQ